MALALPYDLSNGDAILTALTKCDNSSWCSEWTKWNATMTMEAFPVGVGAGNSLSHPWGTAATIGIVQGLAGIQQTAPGYASFTVRPRLGQGARFWIKMLYSKMKLDPAPVGRKAVYMCIIRIHVVYMHLSGLVHTLTGSTFVGTFYAVAPLKGVGPSCINSAHPVRFYQGEPHQGCSPSGSALQHCCDVVC
jgi:hypothetical protein